MNDSFIDKFNWSKEPQHVRQELFFLQRLFPNSRADVADTVLDRRGADYVVKHSNGVSYVDFKRRQRGCSRYWRDKTAPEIPIEIWNDIQRQIPGWTFRRDYITNDTIFVFDSSDSDVAYVVDFRELQHAAFQNVRYWKKMCGSRKISSRDGSRYWLAETIFLPITELAAAGVQITTIPAIPARESQQKSLPN